MRISEPLLLNCVPGDGITVSEARLVAIGWMEIERAIEEVCSRFDAIQQPKCADELKHMPSRRLGDEAGK